MYVWFNALTFVLNVPHLLCKQLMHVYARYSVSISTLLPKRWQLVDRVSNDDKECEKRSRKWTEDAPDTRNVILSFVKMQMRLERKWRKQESFCFVCTFM